VLEEGATVLQGVSRLATATVLIADTVHLAKTGNWHVLAGDTAEALAGEATGSMGTAANAVNRATNQALMGPLAESVFNAAGTAVATLWPNNCK
jgi:hypothetical protein